jgi:hypothetical protein
MSLATDIHGEIRVLTQHLTQASICQENRFPEMANKPGGVTEVRPEKSMDLSGSLKNVPYRDAYESVRQGKAYNMMLLDGALLHFRYCIHTKKQIVKHSLSFWPSPRLISSDQTPWIYEDDEPFGDAVDERGVLPVPIRFEYAPEQFKEFYHPRCHATLGQYPNCRIAVAGPIRPGLFLNFVLHNFYQRELGSLGKNFPFELFESACSMTSNEARHMLHLMIPKLK